MRMSVALVTAVAAITVSASSWAQPLLGPDAAACAGSPAGRGAAAVVTVDGFKDRQGRLRVQLYGDEPDEFLEKGAKLKRIDVPVTASGPMRVCVGLPAPGAYAVAVLHDRKANHRLDVMNDGVGFSGNPKLTLAKPKYKSVVFDAAAGLTPINVVLAYRSGLSVKPIRR